MKKIGLFVGSAAFALMFFFANQVQAQICAYGSDVIICTNKIVGQEESGTLGTFTGTEEWSALGKAPVAGPGTDKPYGLRLQRNSSQALFQIKRREFDNCLSASSDDIKSPGIFDANVFWGTTRPLGGNIPPLSRLDFNYLFQDQNGIPSVSQTNFMSLVGAFCKQVNASGGTICCGSTGGPCFGRVGIETTCPSYTLDVNGLTQATGYLVASDRRFKQDINTITNSMDLIRQLRGTTYRFKAGDDLPRDFSDEGITPGMIAQEVENVIPEVVFTDEAGYKAINYIGLIPYLIEGVKNLDEEHQALVAEVEDLKAQVSNLNSPAEKGAQPGSVGDLSREAELFQNVPNPFNESTTIRYFLPENSGNAVLLVFDMNGRKLMNIPVEGAGEGQVTIDGGQLEAGMYFYSLIANDREIDTRRMILTD